MQHFRSCLFIGILMILTLTPRLVAGAPDIDFAQIAPGEFTRGDDQGQWDEKPTHSVVITRGFEISLAPITYAQYEYFDADHRRVRVPANIQAGNDDPVVFVSWYDAAAYCRWLTDATGEIHRLPTEVEWEFARKSRPELFEGDVRVESWCYDWYGPYPESSQTDALGHTTGDARVVRGGPFRAADDLPHPTNRLSNLPADRNRLVGFRIVRGELPDGFRIKERATPRWAREVTKSPHDWKPTVDMSRPFFAEPVPYVKIPAELAGGPLFTEHNHDPALTYCDNGDLLAIWYSCIREQGRELSIAASRYRRATQTWDEADLFWDVAGRNDHAPALWNDGKGRLYHFNGMGVDTGWGELALVMRTSDDHGATWSAARILDARHGLHNMPIPGVFQTSAGSIILTCDAVTGGHGGSVIHVSDDAGRTWRKPAEGKPSPTFKPSHSGAWIAGIHAGVAERSDGALIALGRGDSIDGQMPRSLSTDGGDTWTYSASPFPPIAGGQRLVLKRLAEGPLLLISFTPGSTFTDANGKEFTGKGMFAALSNDDGETWPVQKLLTDGVRRELDGLAHTDLFIMDPTHAEPKGYLAIEQTPDGMIHLISSGIHYRFYHAWLMQPNAPPRG